MKVLFLDVDGVLNSHRTGGRYALKKKCLRLLQQVIQDTGAQIVLSSTWRMDEYAFRRLTRVLAYRGIKILGKTDVLYEKRGYEIQKWLDEHPGVTKYAIVDDDSDMLDSQLRHFFQTDGLHGMTETIAYRVTYHLNT